MMSVRWSGRGGPAMVRAAAFVLGLATPFGCIDLANLHAVPDGGSPSGAGSGGAPFLGSGGAPFLGSGGAPFLGSGGAPFLGSGGAPSLGSGGAPVTVPAGTGGAIAGSGGATTPPPGTVSVEVRDIDGDGRNEVVVVDNSTGMATIFEDEPGEPVGKPLPGGFSGRVVSGDFDGDGSTDLAFLSLVSPSSLGSGDSVQVFVALNDGVSGRFAPPVAYVMVGMRADLALPSLAALDADGDGRLDLRVIGNEVADLRNNGHGAFSLVLAHGAFSGCPGCLLANPAAQPGP